MKKVFAVVMLLLTMAGAAFALSDAEYTTLKKSNADFARADKRLTQVWKKLKADSSKAVFAELQEYQREWIASGRDDEARELMKEVVRALDADIDYVEKDRLREVELYSTSPVKLQIWRIF